MKMIAFDLGASSGKVLLGSFTGKSLELREVKRFENKAVQIRDEIFWDVLRIFEELKTGISDGFKIEKQIKSIGFDSFSNDFGLLDHNGCFINQVHCYRDNRTKRNKERIFKKMSRERIHALSGNQIALFSTLMQLSAMQFEAQGYLLNNSCKLLFLPDLFSYFLTGVIGSEYTISSVSQMWDFKKRNWSGEILDAFEIPRGLLAPILNPGDKIGEFSDPTITSGKNLEVVAVCEHDTASAFLAAPFGDDSIIISSGTWSLVGIETDRHIINDFTYHHNIANEGGYPGHHRLLKNVMGLWLIQECRKEFKDNGCEYSYVELMKMGEEEKPFIYTINPNDERFFSPGNMINKIKDFCVEKGQGCPNRPGEIIRCIIESLALQYRLVIEELETVSNRYFSKINIVGGGSNNVFLNQCVADAADKQVISGPNEATAIGNLIVQLISQGEVSSVKEGRQVIQNSFKLEFSDPKNRTGWDSHYERYKKMIEYEMFEDRNYRKEHVKS